LQVSREEAIVMKVREIMTRDVIACQKETDLGAAARLMLGGGCGMLPVTDARGRLIGIITDRDIAVAAATRQRNAAHIAVHEAMSSRVRSCYADDGVTDALKQMAEAGVRRLPVVTGDGRLAGIVSMDDIVLRALDRPGGIASSAFVNAFIAICSRPAVEPDVDASETSVSG
jgi:CBS domain-containing protein